MSQPSITAQIAQLQGMTVGQLRQEYLRLFGEEARSRNRTWLWKRCAWRVQELEYGGLSERAQRRLEELMPNAEFALRVPQGRFQEFKDLALRQTRDARIPRPGTVVLKNYKGRRIVVEVLANGFSYEGQTFRSLSAVAREVTGTRWNGLLFFNLAGKKAPK